MRSKDCRHYSRRELIEIIYELEQREARLERKLEKTRGKLKIRTERMARASAEPTHNHPEGVKGACSVAAAIFLARQGQCPEEIRDHIQRAYGYDLSQHIPEIGNTGFDSTCQGSVPQAIVCALETASVEDAVRSAILLRGDADTQGAIAGSIAEALWGVPEDLKNEAEARLDGYLRDCLQRWRSWLAGRRA